jgi:conjugal transfer pilus assembly protein TraA
VNNLLSINITRKHANAIAIVACLTLVATNAVASTTGTEFQTLFTWLLGEVQGYGGKTIAIAAVGIGAILSIARVNPIPILGGIGFAVFLQYVPTIITGILSATI